MMKTIVLTITAMLSLIVFDSKGNAYTGVANSSAGFIQSDSSKFKVYGKCGMCKKRIEKAANELPGVEAANWNIESKVLAVRYDNSAISEQQIHEQIAKTGYDTELVRASGKAYSELPGCCKYNRSSDEGNKLMKKTRGNENGDQHEAGVLQFDRSVMMKAYAEISTALLNDDPKAAATAAEIMMKLAKGSDSLKKDLQTIAGSEDLKEQRKAFSRLSEEMYQLAKKDDIDEPLYWNYCPMAAEGEGANWLSFSEEINNPYMGQKMPRCGSVKEILN